MLAEAGSDDEIVVEVEKMTREAGIMAGIIPITGPSIKYGGYFLLTRRMKKAPGTGTIGCGRILFARGTSHGGVIVIL